MDLSVAGMRVLREVAERGSFTASAQALGYTQSAVSRQVAALELAAGARLFERRRTGVQLTAAGHVLLRHAVVALDAIEAAEAELAGTTREPGRVRLGMFAMAAAVIVPRALAALRRHEPDLRVTTREAATPSLVRALRARTLDAAILSSRPPHRSPDTERPPLHVETLFESRLMVAVPANGRLAGLASVPADELAAQPWIASSSAADDQGLGVWPGLPGRPEIRHVARDWLAKLQLVAAGAGVTTVAAELAPVLPPGVRLVRIDGVAEEVRRVSWVRLPGPVAAPTRAVAEALRNQAAQLSA